MALKIVEIHRRDDPKGLNLDWVVVHNSSDQPVSLRGCVVNVSNPNAKKSRKAAKLDPGFKLEADGKKRLVAGNPRSKAHGTPPEDDVENYFLFMKVGLVDKPGIRLRIVRGQLTLAEGIYEPKEENGVAG